MTDGHRSRQEPGDTVSQQTQQTQQPHQTGRNSGEGSGSALEAMLKKRREGANHPAEPAERPVDTGAAEA